MAGREVIQNGQTVDKVKYIYDLAADPPRLLLEIDPLTGQPLRSYVHAGRQTLAMTDHTDNDKKHFLLHDRLGSVRQVIDAEGNVENSYTYDPFGNELEAEATVDNPFRFAGYLWDAAAELYYCTARWYDPELQRFTSRDPVTGNFTEPMTLHAYLYCLNDPVNKIDPEGEFWGFLGAIFGYGVGYTLQHKYNVHWVIPVGCYVAATGLALYEIYRVWIDAYIIAEKPLDEPVGERNEVVDEALEEIDKIIKGKKDAIR